MRVDGTSLTSSEIGATIINYAPCDGKMPALASMQLVPSQNGVPLTGADVQGLQPSTLYCFTAQTQDTDELVSDPSNVATKMIPAIPGSPTVVLVTSDKIAYKLRQGVDTVEFIQIGTLPAGTTCNESHNFDGFYPVTDRNMTILATKFDTLPLNVFTHCN